MGTAARNQTEGRDYIRKGREGGRGEDEGFPLAGSLALGAAGAVRGRQRGMRWGRQHRSAAGSPGATKAAGWLRHNAPRGAARSLLGNFALALHGRGPPFPAAPSRDNSSQAESPPPPSYHAPSLGMGAFEGLLPVWSQLSVGFRLHRVLLVHPRAVEVPVQGTAAVLAQRLHAEAVGVQALCPGGAPRQTVTS